MSVWGYVNLANSRREYLLSIQSSTGGVLALGSLDEIGAGVARLLGES